MTTKLEALMARELTVRKLTVRKLTVQECPKATAKHSFRNQSGLWMDSGENVEYWMNMDDLTRFQRSEGLMDQKLWRVECT